MVKDPGKVIKMHGGVSTRKEGVSAGISHTAAKKIPLAQDHKTKEGPSATPKPTPKKEK